MLAIKKSEKATPCVVNVLPCRIQHNGPANASTRHWTPESSSSDNLSSTAYFRGRKLNGKTVNLPEGYRGAIVEKTNTVLPLTITPSSSLQEDDEFSTSTSTSTPETKILQEIAGFDKIVVWGHEVQPDGQEDVYVRGVGEWIGLATAMNSFDD